MHTLSIFQLLPSHVAKLIVNHVMGCSRLQFDGIDSDSVEYKKLLWPLLQVCHNIRTISHPLYCNDYRLHLYVYDDDISVEECSWTKRINRPGYPFHLLSREIQIRVYVSTIFEGKALELLSTEPYDGCAFRWARELSFDMVTDVDWDEDYEHFPPDAEANIAAFVQRIKEMAPRVTQIYMDFSERKGQLVTRYSSYVYYLFSELFKLAKVIMPSDTSYMRVSYLDFKFACKLVRIDSNVAKDTWSILKLARLNAHTLQNIHFWSNREVDISGLIRDSNGDKYEEYPCLRTLEIDIARVSALSHRSKSEGAIPFPSLQRLVVSSSYPFGDDVVFRGNGCTLEYLKAALYPELVELLKRYDVFTRTSHPKLKCVDTRLLSSHLPNPFATATAYLRFVFSIAPGASVHVIAGLPGYGKDLSPVLSILGDYTNIQALSFPAVHLSLWEAVTLIKSLPLLSDLCTGNPALGEIPQGATEADLPEYVRSTYAPMGKRFRRLLFNGWPRSLVCNVYWSSPPPQQVGQDHSAIYPPNTETNIRAFAQRVKQMAPMVGEIVVHPCYVSDDLHPAAGHLFGYLPALSETIAVDTQSIHA
ncbi:hypothetical protein GGI17_000529 [Coemansia sp. S146]|nr:hypothetical protein GGI17_000529 [Coemansia sp. S146]